MPLAQLSRPLKLALNVVCMLALTLLPTSPHLATLAMPVRIQLARPRPPFALVMLAHIAHLVLT